MQALCTSADALAAALENLAAPAQAEVVYNPLIYARDLHRAYLRRCTGTGRILMLGMNPGPFGMVQTGVPFGEISAVRDWLKIEGRVEKPPREHPKRPIQGFGCQRSEVSGKRLWGLMADIYGNPDAFFEQAMIMNYCPLAFVSDTGRNMTPDKLPRDYRQELYGHCDRHLQQVLDILQPGCLIGIGAFAAQRLRQVCPEQDVHQMLHPSPASPRANRNWSGEARGLLEQIGVLPS